MSQKAECQFYTALGGEENCTFDYTPPDELMRPVCLGFCAGKNPNYLKPCPHKEKS